MDENEKFIAMLKENEARLREDEDGKKYTEIIDQLVKLTNGEFLITARIKFEGKPAGIFVAPKLSKQILLQLMEGLIQGGMHPVMLIQLIGESTQILENQKVKKTDVN